MNKNCFWRGLTVVLEKDSNEPLQWVVMLS